MSATTFDCQECGSRYEGPNSYHPYLFCELLRLGHPDPMAYLASYGFTREFGGTE